MNEEKLDNLYAVIVKLQRIFAAVVVVFTLGVSIYKGFLGKTSSSIVSGFIIGLTSAFIILVAFAFIDFGLRAWDKSTEWLISQIRKYPNLRRWVIFPGILVSFVTPYFILKNWEAEVSLKIFVGIYLALILPAAIISFVRDDNQKERNLLSKKITREIRIENPQAAIQNAFVVFEDHLLQRFPANTKLYGNRLIQAAYQGKDSKLLYIFNGKDYTQHVYNLMTGTYSIYRNPRQHIIVDDDEEKAHAIIALVEQLIEFVDKSEDRNKA